MHQATARQKQKLQALYIYATRTNTTYILRFTNRVCDRYCRLTLSGSKRVNFKIGGSAFAVANLFQTYFTITK